MTKTIRVFGRKKFTKEGHKPFCNYTYTKDGKTFYRVKFNRTCNNTPTGSGYYLLTVDTKNLTLQHFSKHPEWNIVIWIADIDKCEVDSKSNEELAQKKIDELNDIL